MKTPKNCRRQVTVSGEKKADFGGLPKLNPPGMDTLPMRGANDQHLLLAWSAKTQTESIPKRETCFWCICLF